MGADACAPDLLNSTSVSCCFTLAIEMIATRSPFLPFGFLPLHTIVRRLLTILAEPENGIQTSLNHLSASGVSNEITDPTNCRFPSLVSALVGSSRYGGGGLAEAI